MNVISTDSLQEILTLVIEYRPALRAVCRRWRGLLNPEVPPSTATPRLSPSELLARDDQKLLEWSFLHGPPSGDLTTKYMSGLARRGLSDDVARVRACVVASGLEGVSLNSVLRAAVECNQVDVAALCIAWGAGSRSLALRIAASRGHLALVSLFCLDWGVSSSGDREAAASVADSNAHPVVASFLRSLPSA